jgi:hypothetical protein
MKTRACPDQIAPNVPMNEAPHERFNNPLVALCSILLAAERGQISTYNSSFGNGKVEQLAAIAPQSLAVVTEANYTVLIR